MTFHSFCLVLANDQTDPDTTAPKQDDGRSRGIPDIIHSPSERADTLFSGQQVPPSPAFLNPNMTSSANDAAAGPAVARLRSSTVTSTTSSFEHVTDPGSDDESSDDSVLSWWSSEEESDGEEELDIEKEAERRKREETRQKILAAAGLILKKEPPPAPKSKSAKTGTQVAGQDSERKRRPAPAAPKRTKTRRKAPGVPKNRTRDATADHSADEAKEPEAEVKDAYAKYEQYLTQSKNRPRASSHVLPPKVDPPVPTSPTPAASSAQTASHPKEGKITGFFSRMMGPSLSHDSGTASGATGRKSISGPIRRTDEGPNEADVGQSEIGKTWSSLVDPSVLETMGSRERKRQEVSPKRLFG